MRSPRSLAALPGRRCDDAQARGDGAWLREALASGRARRSRAASPSIQSRGQRGRRRRYAYLTDQILTWLVYDLDRPNGLMPLDQPRRSPPRSRLCMMAVGGYGRAEMALAFRRRHRLSSPRWKQPPAGPSRTIETILYAAVGSGPQGPPFQPFAGRDGASHGEAGSSPSGQPCSKARYVWGDDRAV